MSAVPVYENGVGTVMSHSDWLQKIADESANDEYVLEDSRRLHLLRAQNMRKHDEQKARMEEAMLEEDMARSAEDERNLSRYLEKYGGVAQNRRLVKLQPLGADASKAVASVRPLSEQYAEYLAAKKASQKRVTFDDDVRVIYGGSAYGTLSQVAMVAVTVAAAIFQSTMA